MKNIYIDIETIPNDLEGMPQAADEDFIVPAEIIKFEDLEGRKGTKDPDKIKQQIADKWIDAQKSNELAAGVAHDKSMELYNDAYKKWAKGSLNYMDCRIVAVSLAFHDDTICQLYSINKLATDELLINQFVSILERYYNNHPKDHIRWVAYNGRGFDFPILWHKVIRQFGYKAASLIPNMGAISQYDTSRVFDPMVNVPMQRTYTGKPVFYGMDKTCKSFKLEGKEGMSGADVLPYFLDGKYSEISEYCADDVHQLRELTKLLGEHS